MFSSIAPLYCMDNKLACQLRYMIPLIDMLLGARLQIGNLPWLLFCEDDCCPVIRDVVYTTITLQGYSANVWDNGSIRVL